MKQSQAIGCDPSEVEFSGSVRNGSIYANSLFNSESFRTALSALQEGGVLDTPGGHMARDEIKERFHLTPCTPDQVEWAANLLADSATRTETSDEVGTLRKLGGDKMGTKPEAFEKMLKEGVEFEDEWHREDEWPFTAPWKRHGWSFADLCLNDEDVEFLVERAQSSESNVAKVKVRHLQSRNASPAVPPAFAS